MCEIARSLGDNAYAGLALMRAAPGQLGAEASLSADTRRAVRMHLPVPLLWKDLCVLVAQCSLMSNSLIRGMGRTCAMVIAYTPKTLEGVGAAHFKLYVLKGIARSHTAPRPPRPTSDDVGYTLPRSTDSTLRTAF